MKQISNKEYEEYQQYQTDKLHGRILTPDGLRVICAGLDNDPEKIGIHVFHIDSAFFLLSSLEVPDDEGNFVRKADMFTKCTDFIIQKGIIAVAVVPREKALTS